MDNVCFPDPVRCPVPTPSGRAGRGPQAWAEVGLDGRYALCTAGKDGAVPGWHRVTIAPLRPRGAGTPVPLPARYRDPELSGQCALVRSGRVNQCDLHLD